MADSDASPGASKSSKTAAGRGSKVRRAGRAGPYCGLWLWLQWRGTSEDAGHCCAQAAVQVPLRCRHSAHPLQARGWHHSPALVAVANDACSLAQMLSLLASGRLHPGQWLCCCPRHRRGPSAAARPPGVLRPRLRPRARAPSRRGRQRQPRPAVWLWTTPWASPPAAALAGGEGPGPPPPRPGRRGHPVPRRLRLA